MDTRTNMGYLRYRCCLVKKTYLIFLGLTFDERREATAETCIQIHKAISQENLQDVQDWNVDEIHENPYV